MTSTRSLQARRRPREELGPEAEVRGNVGRSLRALRTRKGYSLERLASASKVSRAMLSQIELGQSAPTITILWRIANALAVPFSALLGTEPSSRATLVRASDAIRLRSGGGGLVSRPLFPFGRGPRQHEFYELRLASNVVEHSPAHPPGTNEHLVVASGSVVISVGLERHELGRGDALQFPADVEHGYENVSEREAVLFLVITYTQA
ncbi:MAG: hypothetical protein RL385_5571 [Pseudomonadota bacterium]|jgi:transcriptional regulator with XRE-family HTH domain